MDRISRRQFIQLANRLAAALGFSAALVPVIAYFYPTKLEETPTEPVLIGKAAEIQLNESKVFKYGRYPAVIVNTSQGLRAYSSVCTHFACIVKWNKDLVQFACPCHAGFYDPLDGHVISGPPPRPLTAIPITSLNGNLYAGEKT